MHVRKTSTRDIDTRNSRPDVGLDLTLLALEAGPCPEADVFRKAGPHKSGGQQPPRSSNTRMLELVERHEQLIDGVLPGCESCGET